MSRAANVAVIPTKDRRVDLLPNLVNDLLAQHELERVLVFDNSAEQDASAYLPIDKRLNVVGSSGDRIYAMWNAGWRRAVEDYGPHVNVAILNDDLVVPDAFISTLAHALRAQEDRWAVFPDYTVPASSSSPTGVVLPAFGTFRHGGMSGFAFMLRGEILDNPVPPVDERFQWWFGDDDLAFNIADLGGTIGRVEGLGIDHIGGGSQSKGSRSHPGVNADKTLAYEKWGFR